MIDKLFKLSSNSFLLVILLLMFAIPLSTLGITRVTKNRGATNQEVLPASTVREHASPTSNRGITPEQPIGINPMEGMMPDFSTNAPQEVQETTESVPAETPEIIPTEPTPAQ